MKPWVARVLLYALLLVAFLGPLIAVGEESPCRREGDRVSCAADGFKTLTDTCVQFRADARTCDLRLQDAKKDIAARDSSLHLCQEALALVPPIEPPRSATRQLVGYVTGMASTAMIMTSVMLSLPPSARFAMVGVGVIGLGSGVILVLP